MFIYDLYFVIFFDLIWLNLFVSYKILLFFIFLNLLVIYVYVIEIDMLLIYNIVFLVGM